MLSCPIRSARNAISLQRSRKLFANLCRNEWGYTTAGLISYLTANFFNCPEMPRVVIRSPYLFKKMKPLSCCFSDNGMLPVKRTIKNNKFLYRQPCYGWRYFMLLLYIAHDISLVSLHAVSFEVVGCCSNLCN